MAKSKSELRAVEIRKGSKDSKKRLNILELHEKIIQDLEVAYDDSCRSESSIMVHYKDDGNNWYQNDLDTSSFNKRIQNCLIASVQRTIQELIDEEKSAIESL